MKKIKIVYINVMDAYSGGEIVLQRLIRGLDKNLFDIIVYTKNTKFVETLNCNECTIVVFNTQYQMKLKRGISILVQVFKNLLISGKYMYDIKYKYNVDIVHSNTLTSSIYFAIWAKIFRVKFISHNHIIRTGTIYNIVYKYISFCSSKIICVSEAVKENWLLAGVPKDKLLVVYSGLPNDFF